MLKTMSLTEACSPKAKVGAGTLAFLRLRPPRDALGVPGVRGGGYDAAVPMRRKLFTLCSAVSLLLCAVGCARAKARSAVPAGTADAAPAERRAGGDDARSRAAAS